MKVSPLSVLALPVLLASLAPANQASAAAIGLGPNLPVSYSTSYNSVVQDPFTPAETAWIVGSPSSPVSLAADPLAGQWMKTLTGAGTLDYAQEVGLIEYLNVATLPHWTDWHETVITPDFRFQFDADDTWYSFDGGTTQLTAGISYNPNFTTVNFIFPNPLVPGQNLLLHKELQFFPVDINAQFNNDTNPIIVQQYPTIPEPATLGLLLVGATGVLTRRRRA